MEPLHVRMMGSGNNWMNVSGIIAVAINSYYSPLPPGSLVSVTTMDPGVGSMDGPKMVGEGQFDVGMTTPGWYGRLALEGKAPFTRAYALRGIALFPHDDRMAIVVRKSTGIREIAEKKIPLRYSIPVVESSHPPIWGADQIFAEYGFSRADLDAWGGTRLKDRPKTQSDPAAEPISADWEALFDEAIMTPHKKAFNARIPVSLTAPVDPAVFASKMPIPLHPGAERYYREKGYVQ